MRVRQGINFCTADEI